MQPRRALPRRNNPTSSSSFPTITPTRPSAPTASKLNKTPNIDRLANEGMRFDRCLVPNSICGPSRATVLTGKYSHINGFYNNTNSSFDGSQTTFPKLLQEAGYQTAIIGKWHLVSDPTGFDYWEILPGQGVYYNPPMIRNGERVKHRGLHDRHHHRPGARLAQETRHGQAVSADVPAQGAAPRVGAEPQVPGPRRRREVSRAGDAVRRLLRPRQGRARPGHDDRQDDERRGT